MIKQVCVVMVAMMLIAGATAQVCGQESVETADTIVNPAQGILERVQMLPASSIDRRHPRQRFET